MTKIVRPKPRRPAWLYPEGTILTLNDGRHFMVVVPMTKELYDPTYGNGGPDYWRLVPGRKEWREV